MRKIADPLLLSTANGLVWATWETCIYIHELEIEVWVILLEITPAVLSLGKLITQNGFNYTWNHGEVPTLQKGNLKVHCYPPNDVPFITNCVTKQNPEQPTPSTVDAQPASQLEEIPSKPKSEEKGEFELPENQIPIHKSRQT